MKVDEYTKELNFFNVQKNEMLDFIDYQQKVILELKEIIKQREITIERLKGNDLKGIFRTG